MSSPLVSVVIPSWNGKALLKVCLNSLRQQTFTNFEIIVVDNGSHDDSAKYLRRFFPEVRIIELANNSGFAPAVNLGIKAAIGKFIFLLNNDTRVDPNCLSVLVKTLDKHRSVGMVAAKMLNYYHPEIIDSAGDYIDSVGHADNIGRGQLDSAAFNQAGPVFLVTGGGAMYRRSIFEQVGLFDEDYFAYFEDVDLGLRAQLQGIKAYYQPQAVIYHIHKATSNRQKSFTEYLQFRNMTMTIIKNFPRPLLWHQFNWLKIILVNLNTIRYLASQGYLKAALSAEWYVFSHLPQLLAKRAQIQSQIKVDPSYIIQQVKPKKVTLFGLIKSGI